MKLHLGGHLAFYEAHKRSNLEVRLNGSVLLAELLRDLNIPCGEVALVVVNGAQASLEAATVTDQDQVAVYPPIGGGNGSHVQRS